MNQKSKAPENIEEMFTRLGEQWARLEDDPRMFNQVQAFTNIAGKAAKLAEIKMLVSIARGVEPDHPMFGKFGTTPLNSLSKLGKPSPKELAFKAFKDGAKQSEG